MPLAPRSTRLGFALAVALAAAFASSRLEAGTAPADPAADGSYLVVTAPLSFTNPDGARIDFDVLLPAGPSFARPTLLFIHGWSAEGIDYSWLTNHLASRGFAVAVYNNESTYQFDPEVWANQAIATIDELARADGDPASPVFGQLDMGRLGVIGHSYGGATTLITAARDPRVKAAVALEPGTQASYHATVLGRAAQVTIPVQVQGGEYDQVVPAWHWARPAFDRIPSGDRLYVEIARADHLNYGDLDFTPFQLLSYGSIPLAAYSPFTPPLHSWQLHPIASRYATSWLERHLLGTPDPVGWTNGTQAGRDFSGGTLSDTSR